MIGGEAACEARTTIILTPPGFGLSIVMFLTGRLPVTAQRQLDAGLARVNPYQGREPTTPLVWRFLS
jgi:hypothetical protein